MVSFMLKFALFLLFPVLAFANIQSQTARPELGITEVTLTNGMRVCFKPTQFDEDEILIRLTARGGYASLPPSQRAAGELAALVAWESGLEGMSTDLLTAKIYEHSIELYVKVLPFHRVIEGATDSEGVAFFFDLAQRYATQKQLTHEGFNRVVAKEKEILKSKEQGRGSSLEEWSRLVHTQDIAALKPLSLQDLTSMEFDRAKQFFEEYFSNPAEFVCVVVGNFELEKLLPIVSRTLGAIPAKSSAAFSPQWPQFPEGVTIRGIPSSEKESLASLTYPLQPIRSPQQLLMAKLAAQVLETRLRCVAKDLSCSLELPLYPGLHLTWLSIQYRSPPTQVEKIKVLLSSEIERLSREGASERELSESWRQLREKERLWQQDNQYWLSHLSDYFLRGWDLQKTEEAQAAVPEGVKEQMRGLINPKQFSFIYTMPF